MCLIEWIMDGTGNAEFGGFEEVFLTLLMLQEVLKLPLKSVNLTNPQSDKVVQMEENSSPLLSFWGVIDQQTTLKKCGLKGHKGTYCNS